MASIQTLRALAALSVALFHRGLFDAGGAGVDIFFVISGFVMGTIGINERPGSFLFRRVVRVVPLYWLVTLAFCAGSSIPGAFNRFTYDFGSLYKSLLFVPYVNKNGDINPLVVQGWSLNYEMFFYVVFAAALFARRPRAFLAIVFLSLTAGGLILRPQTPILKTYTDPMMLEFLAGFAASQLNILRSLARGIFFLLAGAAMFVIAAVTPLLDAGQLIRVFWLGVASLGLVAGAVSIERSGHWPRLHAAELLGDASYSLYLLHGAIMAFTGKFIPLPETLAPFMAIASSIGGALLTYFLFEKPVARLLRRAVRTRQSPAVAAAG